MAHDRYDTRTGRDRAYSDYERGRRDDRGFFERAGDEIASWFGDDEAERRRRDEERMNRDPGRDFERGSRSANQAWGDRADRLGHGGQDRDFRARGYGWGGGYGPASYSAPGYGAGIGYGGGDYGRSEGPLSRDEFRRSGFAGPGRDSDRHYHAWKQRQLDALDRDYDEYCRERQERFEEDFGAWREKRQHKRGLLGRIREHMEVVGSDGETIGKVDCVKGDRVILTKADSKDNRHHSIKCSMIETVDGDQVRLDIPAEEARSRLRDEEDRGLFRRWDEGESEPANLDRGFAGTYR